MKHFLTTTSLQLLLILNVHLPFGDAHAQESSPFYWEYINVKIDLQQNGDMLVTETQKYVFTDSHTNERYRWLPLDSVEAIKDITVFEKGDSLSVSTGVKNDQQWIRWLHQLNPPESRTFTLMYRVIGATRFGDYSDLVTWKAIIADRSAPIQSAKITFRVPSSLSGRIIRFKSYDFPTNQQQIDSRTIEFTSRGVLLPGKSLRILVIFSSGRLDSPIPKSQQQLKTSANGGDTNWQPWFFGLLTLWIVVGLLSQGYYYQLHNRYASEKEFPLWLLILVFGGGSLFIGNGSGSGGGGGGGTDDDDDDDGGGDGGED